MKIIYKGSIKGSRLEMEPLNNYISDSIASSTTLYFTLVDGAVFNSKFDAFVITDDNYLKDKNEAQIYRQEGIPLLAKLSSYNRDIAQYVKTTLLNNTKKLTDWGIPIKLGKLGGEILLSRKIKEVELASKSILDKHTLDGANSILANFNMSDMQATYDAYVLSRANYKDSQNKWRAASIVRREDMKELRKMQHLIARELISNPTFNDRDLEQLGYILIENHDYGNNNETQIDVAA